MLFDPNPNFNESFIVASFSFTMAMPHFVMGPYVLEEAVARDCDLSSLKPCCMTLTK